MEKQAGIKPFQDNVNQKEEHEWLSQSLRGETPVFPSAPPRFPRSRGSPALSGSPAWKAHFQGRQRAPGPREPEDNPEPRLPLGGGGQSWRFPWALDARAFFVFHNRNPGLSGGLTSSTLLVRIWLRSCEEGAVRVLIWNLGWDLSPSPAPLGLPPVARDRQGVTFRGTSCRP